MQRLTSFTRFLLITRCTKIQLTFKDSTAGRHFWKNMDCCDLCPPAAVRGMTILNRDAFRKVIQVPKILVPECISYKAIKLLKTVLLKMERFKPVRNEDTTDFKVILLHPLAVRDWNSLPTKSLEEIGINQSSFHFGTVELTYDNWRPDEIFKYVLPESEEGLTSFSRVGHIVHINLRDHLLPYKKLIGEVIRDKVSGCRTVVNKLSSIENTYRNFQMEVICGDENYKVEIKENGIIFEFDFSKVYWNPRLSTEHERIIKILSPQDLLYDVFAGVGPFSVPAAKKGCHVLSNDLNPDSFKWLNVNAQRNKCSKQMKTFNKDGRAFIVENVKEDLIKRWSQGFKSNIHITMNLPDKAPEFLSTFRGLFESLPIDQKILNYPIVHLYTFAKGDNRKSIALEIVEKHLGWPLGENLEGVYFVRNVAPNKDMYRISFYLTEELLTTTKQRHILKRPASTSENEINPIRTKQKPVESH